MKAWSGQSEDVMGPTVSGGDSTKPATPPLKNGRDLRETGYLIAVGSRTARFRRKHKNKMVVVLLLTCVLLLLCWSITMTVLYVKQKRHKPARVCESRECLRSASNLALSMDKSVDPCKDFYKYACGNWGNEHPRPDAYSSYDWFRVKQNKVYALVRDFLNKNSTGHPVPVTQARDMYAACMDTETLDKLALDPIFKVLDKIGLPHYPTFINVTEVDYATYRFDWLEVVINIKTYLGMDVLIGFDIFTDPKNSSVYRLAMGSPETTNPFPSLKNEKKRSGRKSLKYFRIPKDINIPDETFSKNYQFKMRENEDNDEKIALIYELYYAQLMKIFVVESGDIKNFNITEIDLDTKIIAAAHEYYMINEENYGLSENDTAADEDLFENIPEYTVYEIQALTDKVVLEHNATAVPIWKKYLEGIFNISDVTLDFDADKVLVAELDLEYMAIMASLLSILPPVAIELYIWVKVVNVMAVHATTELRRLYQRSEEQLQPRHATPTRSLECANAANDMLGMALAHALVEPHFFNITKPKIETMLFDMKNSLASLVGKAKWMDDDTKLATYLKIIQMKTLVGFPDWLLEEGRLEEYYQGIVVNKEKHLENMISIIQAKIKKSLNRYRELNNFTWATDPTDVNAYHTFQENTITVPIVMLQYPFFDLGLDSLNYGSLGSILGHEITHGFDNFGRKFDNNGNMVAWWTNETVRSYVNMTQCFVRQYSEFYLPQTDKHVDGKKTLGENIADNGGVREALRALRRHLHRSGPEDKLPGFEHYTSEQLFFLSFGNLWCSVSTEESLEADLDDEHSPQMFRAQGALQNNEDFARAWHCPLGSPMNPHKRCIVF